MDDDQGSEFSIGSCGDDIFKGRLSGRFILCANCNDGLYGNGTGDQLDVPLGTTAFVSGKKMFEILSLELKSLAESRWRIWNNLGTSYLGFEESKIKTFPVLWKNPSTVTIGKRKISVCSTAEEFSTQSLERLRRIRTKPSGNATWPLAMNLLELTLMIFKDSSEHL
ncbi:hypothetical protein BY996DRAFT_6551685 [Phakopsora pachyrhizi]|nr:hypothetical protein BY996DRAFT_6551685 [Phakopsora pachyrhizi]